MSLEDIFRALEQEAKERCAEIRMQTGAEVAQIEADAAKLRDEICVERMKRATGPLEARARRIVNDARFERRREVASERERLVEGVYDEAAEELAKLRTDPSYPERFGAMLDEALAAAREPSAVSVDPADEALARAELARRGLSLPVHTDVASAGGVVVHSAGGRVKHDNTFEARLARVRAESRTHVSELLFG